LIEAAAEVFSTLGYKSASTRNIVERAQTNLNSISYYFGSKRELYNAAADFIGSNISDCFRPACDRAREGILKTTLTHEELLSMFTEFIVEIAHIMVGADTTSLWGQFIYREQINPTDALEIIHTKCAPMFELGFEYISRLKEWPLESSETRMQFFAILSMIKFIRADRGSTLRIMGWKVLGDEEKRIVESMLRHNTHALLSS
jgi:AcrR family transcriptional regulator